MADEEVRRLARLAGNGDVAAARCLLAMLERPNLSQTESVIDWCVRAICGGELAVTARRIRFSLGRDKTGPWFWQVLETRKSGEPWKVYARSPQADAHT
jgi:hypothetical protein